MSLIGKNERIFDVKHNVSVETLREKFEYFNSFPGVVASDVVFTFNPSKVSSINSLKSRCMDLVNRRLKGSKGIFSWILTRENHASGMPHIHAIVWYPKNDNNALTLTGASASEFEQVSKRGFAYRGCIGRVTVYSPIRLEPYVQSSSGKEYDDSLDYILKDQDVKWKDANLVGSGDVTLDLYATVENENNFVV